MKKLLSTLSVLGLSVSTSSTLIQNTNTNIVNTDQDFYNFGFLTSNIENKKQINLEVINKDKYQRNIISRYPKKIGKPSDFNGHENLDMFKEISAKDRKNWFGQSSPGQL